MKNKKIFIMPLLTFMLMSILISANTGTYHYDNITVTYDYINKFDYDNITVIYEYDINKTEIIEIFSTIDNFYSVIHIDFRDCVDSYKDRNLGGSTVGEYIILNLCVLKRNYNNKNYKYHITDIIHHELAHQYFFEYMPIDEKDKWWEYCFELDINNRECNELVACTLQDSDEFWGEDWFDLKKNTFPDLYKNLEFIDGEVVEIEVNDTTIIVEEEEEITEEEEEQPKSKILFILIPIILIIIAIVISVIVKKIKKQRKN